MREHKNIIQTLDRSIQVNSKNNEHEKLVMFMLEMGE